MAISVYERFLVLLKPDGSSTSLSFDVRNVPVLPATPSGTGNSFTPICDLSQAIDAVINTVADGNGANITATIVSASFQRHVLTIVFNSAPAANMSGNSAFINFDLLF